MLLLHVVEVQVEQDVPYGEVNSQKQLCIHGLCTGLSICMYVCMYEYMYVDVPFKFSTPDSITWLDQLMPHQVLIFWVSFY